MVYESGTVNIVFELLTGGELLKKLQDHGPLSELQASEYMREILSGVAYCHTRHYMHRDLKPENIVFETNSQDSMVKIVDFGTCIEISGKERQSPPVGTKIYIAPEVSFGKFDEKCDIWSCGVLAYLMLTGDLPGNWGNSTMEDKVLTKKLDLTRITASAKSFLMKTLAYEPCQRASARDLLGHPWLQRSKATFTSPETESIQRLAHFHVESKLKQAALSYIATQLLSVQETEAIRRLFVGVDEDRDGRLSPLEFRRLLDRAKIPCQADICVLIARIDFDHNGFIDYTEFLTAAMDWKRVLSNTQVDIAFQAFDKNHSSFIELRDIQRVFAACQVTPFDPEWSHLLGPKKDQWKAVSLQQFRTLVMG